MFRGDYLGRFAPSLVAGDRGLILGFAMIALCAAWNLTSVRAMGDGYVALNIALFVPFAVLIVIALAHRPSVTPAPVPLKDADLLGGVLIAMWNYMGVGTNLSTIAGEVGIAAVFTRARCSALWRWSSW